MRHGDYPHERLGYLWGKVVAGGRRGGYGGAIGGAGKKVKLNFTNFLTTMHKVTIYSTPSCVYCKMAKEFFVKNGVTYEEHNVASDLAAREAMVEKSHQLGVPVIEVDDNIIIGFDQRTLEQVLELKK